MGRVEDAIGALKLEYPTLDFSYRDFPLGEPGEKMFTWPGPPDEDVMIVVHQCSGVRELFHRHDFFYFNYTYCGSYDSLSQRYDNVVTIREGELYAGQPFAGHALLVHDDADTTIIGMLVQGALLAAGILVPIYLQSLMGYSATVSGLVLLPGAIIMGAMGPIAGRLFDKHGPRVLALVGMGVLTLTTFCFCFLGPNMGLITLTVLYTVRLFSLSLVNMPITTWGMNALSNELVNHGTSVNNTFRQVAGSLGTAIIVSASTIATNMSSRTMTPTQASIFGIDVAFALAGALCLVGFVMVVALVKNKPGEAAEKDRDNSRRTVLESIMKRDVFTLPSNATVAEAMKLLVDKHISAAPLVNAEGKAVGFVSDGDIMRYLSKRSTMMMDPVVMIMQTVDADGGNKDFARKLDELMGMQALSIGAKGIIGVDVHADLPEVCRVLGENHLKKVPVLDEGQVVGVINRSDITHYSMEQYLAERGDEALAAGSGEGQGPTKLERAEEAAALPDDEAVASSI